MLLVVTGASGAGKSTARVAVEPSLAPLVESVELSHLVPMPASATKAWRQQTAEAAVRRAVELRATGRHLLLAGDPVAAVEVAAAPSAPGLDGIAVCLLDLNPEAQAERLRARGDDPDLLVHHQAFAEWMRVQATDPLHMTDVVRDGGWEGMRWERLSGLVSGWQMRIIDTSEMTKTDVASAVLRWCRQALSGEAPALRVTDP